jgi:thiol-disulfide isomerase/thioredoxin
MPLSRRVLVVFAVCALLPSLSSAPRRAPGFALPEMPSGARFHDLADYRGKVVLIDIMQTTCPHCQTLSRTLERMKARFGASVAVLSIIVPPDNASTASSYIATHRISTPVLFDCGQMAASYLRVGPANPKVDLPHLFVIDAEGMIQGDYAWSAANKSIFEEDGLIPMINGLLKPAAGKKR